MRGRRGLEAAGLPPVTQERSGHFARQINGRAEPEHLATVALRPPPAPCDRRESEGGCPGHLKQVVCRTALCPASGRFFGLLVVQGGRGTWVWASGCGVEG